MGDDLRNMAKRKKISHAKPQRGKLSLDTWMNIFQTIIIGLIGLYLAGQANQISNTQLQLSMAQSVPQIRVNLRQVYNEEIERVDTHNIEISCEEGFFTNYKSYAASFLTIRGLNNYDIQIPIHGYWAAHSLTGNTNGTIETVLGWENHSKIKAVCDEFRKLTDEVITFDIETYLRISYIDILGEYQSRYYYVQPVRGTTIIEAEICESKLQLFDESYFNDNHINLDTWTPESLEQLIFQHTEQKLEISQ